MATFVAIEYDPLAFDTPEVSELKEEFADRGPIRIRSIYKERGPDFTILWIILSYIGLEYIKGFVSGVASKHAEEVSEKLRGFFARHPKFPGNGFPAVCVRFSFDDVDVSLQLPCDPATDYVKQALARIADHLQSEPLCSRNVRSVVIPAQFEEVEGWIEVVSDWSVAQGRDRYWGVGEHDSSYPTALYDSVKREFVEESLPPTGTGPELATPA